MAVLSPLRATCLIIFIFLDLILSYFCMKWILSTHFFDVLLTVQHLSIFTLVINQLDAQNLFYNKFISCLYMFRAPRAHRQEIKIVLYSLLYHYTYRRPFRSQVLSQPVYRTATYKCDDTRGLRDREGITKC